MTEKEFWDWFLNNNAQFTFINDVEPQEKERLLSVLQEKIHLYDKGLFFNLGGYSEGVTELIITAEGNREKFDVVETLVSSAPNMEDWKIIAFKPAMGIDFEINYEDMHFDPREIWFVPLRNTVEPNQIGLRLGIKDYNRERETKTMDAMFIILDTLLGEKESAEFVHYVEVSELPEDPDGEGYYMLESLPDYISFKIRGYVE